MEPEITSPSLARPNRPTGVWVLSLYALIFVGLLPALLGIYVLVSGQAAGNELDLLLALPISLGALISAYGAWKGDNRARKSLLFFVSLHYAFIALNNFLVIQSGQVPDDQLTTYWGRVLRVFVYPVLYIWYFTKPTTKEFYE